MVFRYAVSNLVLYQLKGYLPGLFGVSHGALQFMAYEELKKLRSSYFGTPVDKKLVGNQELLFLFAVRLNQYACGSDSLHFFC